MHRIREQTLNRLHVTACTRYASMLKHAPPAACVSYGPFPPLEERTLRPRSGARACPGPAPSVPPSVAQGVRPHPTHCAGSGAAMLRGLRADAGMQYTLCASWCKLCAPAATHRVLAAPGRCASPAARGRSRLLFPSVSLCVTPGRTARTLHHSWPRAAPGPADLAQYASDPTHTTDPLYATRYTHRRSLSVTRIPYKLIGLRPEAACDSRASRASPHPSHFEPHGALAQGCPGRCRLAPCQHHSALHTSHTCVCVCVAHASPAHLHHLVLRIPRDIRTRQGFYVFVMLASTAGCRRAFRSSWSKSSCPNTPHLSFKSRHALQLHARAG